MKQGSLSRRSLLLGIAAMPAAGCAGPLLDAARQRRANAAEGSEDEIESSGRLTRMKGEVPLPPGARLIRDVAFGSDPQQRFDVYIPAGARNAPIIFMVHGGAWMIGDKAYLPVVKSKVRRWLPRGYILVSTNYRMSFRPDVLDQVNDVGSALALVQKTAPEWGGNASRLLLMGHSAGAHLVALLASSPELKRKHGLQPWNGTVVLDSAVFDLRRIMAEKHHSIYDRAFGSDPERWRLLSPVDQLGGQPPPYLLVCSEMRQSCEKAEAFAATLKARGLRGTVLPVALNHGDVNTLLGESAGYTEKIERFMREVGLPD